MSFKEYLRRWKDRNLLLAFLYEHIYLRYVLKIKYNVKIKDYGKGNSVRIPRNTRCDDLRIIFKGNNNVVRIGEGCELKNTNMLYIQDDGNELIINDYVIFDQDVSIVLGEGTRCEIGSECIFAKGVRIRTCDQHFIYDSENNRINTSKAIYIGKHVWCGASAIIMKGVSIGNGSVIGMDAMVTKDIPDNCIAVGKPAKVIRDNVYWKEY